MNSIQVYEADSVVLGVQNNALMRWRWTDYFGNGQNLKSSTPCSNLSVALIYALANGNFLIQCGFSSVHYLTSNMVQKQQYNSNYSNFKILSTDYTLFKCKFNFISFLVYLMFDL
jgi:hypothetical protein